VDNSTELEWSAPRAALIAAGIGGVILGVLAVVATSEPAGLVLAGLAAIGLLALSAVGFVRRPRLAVRPGTGAAPARLEVRGLRGITSYRAVDIAQARLLSFRRWGRSVPNLEIDLTSGKLLIFGRWDLGTHPDDVLDALIAHGLAER